MQILPMSNSSSQILLRSWTYTTASVIYLCNTKHSSKNSHHNCTGHVEADQYPASDRWSTVHSIQLH